MKFLTVEQYEAFLNRVEAVAVELLGVVVIEAAVDPMNRGSEEFAQRLRPRVENLVDLIHSRGGDVSASPPGAIGLKEDLPEGGGA